VRESFSVKRGDSKTNKKGHPKGKKSSNVLAIAWELEGGGSVND